MGLNLKGKPRGRPFRSGIGGDFRRNAGGKPFIKLHQKLSAIVAAQLDELAPAEIVQTLGLLPDSTYGVCIARCAVELASRGDLSAARFVFDCTEAAKVRVDLNQKQEVNIHVVSENARYVVDRLLGQSQQARDCMGQDESPILDVKPLTRKPS